MGKCKLKIVNICFYCKQVILNKKDKCSNCNRATRIIKVKTIRERLTPWWVLFNAKYRYTVIDSKFKYIERQLNCE